MIVVWIFSILTPRYKRGSLFVGVCFVLLGLYRLFKEFIFNGYIQLCILVALVCSMWNISVWVICPSNFNPYTKSTGEIFSIGVFKVNILFLNQFLPASAKIVPFVCWIVHINIYLWLLLFFGRHFSVTCCFLWLTVLLTEKSFQWSFQIFLGKFNLTRSSWDIVLGAENCESGRRRRI